MESVQAAYGHACFACGRHNPVGLAMRIEGHVDGIVTASFEARDDHRGTPNVLHGGIAATAIDEIMVWAAILAEGVMCVTAGMELRYRRPLPVGGRILAQGWVEERSGRRLRLAGRLLAGEEPAVEANGLYVASAEVADIVATRDGEPVDPS